MTDPKPLPERAKKLLDKLDREARAGGYYLNPDREITLMLMEGLVTNTDRYGYMSCPCRLAAGRLEDDLDIICPCDYRDPDLDDYSTCFCGLYVAQAVADGKKKIGSIPERRPGEEERKARAKKGDAAATAGGLQVWRCKVCGYLCARENPPEKCPICKAQRERFEPFSLK